MQVRVLGDNDFCGVELEDIFSLRFNFIKGNVEMWIKRTTKRFQKAVV